MQELTVQTYQDYKWKIVSSESEQTQQKEAGMFCQTLEIGKQYNDGWLRSMLTILQITFVPRNDQTKKHKKTTKANLDNIYEDVPARLCIAKTFTLKRKLFGHKKEEKRKPATRERAVLPWEYKQDRCSLQCRRVVASFSSMQTANLCMHLWLCL